MDKILLRKKLLEQRAALPAAEASRLSILIQKHILANPAWQRAKQVLIYSPIRNEVDTKLLFEDALATGKEVLFPRCVPGSAGIMDLAACPGPDALCAGTFGIMEPCPDICPALRGADIHPETAVVPGVGFDRQCGRLGYGAGYYDRILEGNEFKHSYLIGAAYSFQVVDNLYQDPWDQRLDAIATEEGIIIP